MNITKAPSKKRASSENMTSNGYHPVTRWLHAGLILGVTFQLSSSLVMTHPDDKEGGPMGQLLMAFHQIDGLIIANIVLANFVWAIVLRGNPEKQQISVLFSIRQWKDALSMLRKLPAVLTGKTPFNEQPRGLATGLFIRRGMQIMAAEECTCDMWVNAYPPA